MSRAGGALGGALVGLLAFAGPAAGQHAGAVSFVMRMGVDTFAVESVSRTADAIEGEIGGRIFGRIAYRAALGPAESISEVALKAWAPGAAVDAAPVQEARITLLGDSAQVEIGAGEQLRRQRIAAGGAALVYLNPSMALMEQMVLRARAAGSERVEVPVLLATGQTFTASVSFLGTDSAVVAIAGGEVRMAVDLEGRLLGGVIPAQNLTITRVAGALPTTFVAQPPDYSAPPGAPYVAEEVSVSTAEGHTLAGTLTRPTGRARVPAVVMISGSGPQERDQAIPMVRGYRPFREIADTLSRRGIAVLRLDDRGTGASTGDFAAATSADFAEDVRAALRYLSARPDIESRRLGLVGHSEGGLIAPMVAADDPSLAAIVLIAGPARTGREVIAYQMREAVDRMPGLTAAQRDSAQAASLAQLEAHAVEQPWMRFFLEHDPRPVARRVVRVPVLILQGETDRQVTADQAELLGAAFRAAGNRDVTVRLFPDVNHLLLRDPDGGPAGYMTLEDPSVVPEVRGALADWLSRMLR
jgi:uncharacterized protein